MRLTLRTLLAYSDDILDPADHEELSKKIEASDFATELIHRTRDTVRRLRLGTPEVLAGGGDGVLDTVSVSDANSVAEYLDNTLAPEDIADFERMCLEPGNEADMHLAEVASCHHVLTMVLGEPAEVDAEVRQRMYELPAKLAAGESLRVEPAHTKPQPQPAVSAAPPVVPKVTPDEPEVPDYLREAARAKSRGKRIALVAALLLVAVGGWFWVNSAEQQSAPTGVAVAEFEDALGDLEIGGIDSAVGEPGQVGEEEGGEAASFDPNATEAAADPLRSTPGEEPESPEAEGSAVDVGEVPDGSALEPVAEDLESSEADAFTSTVPVADGLDFPEVAEPGTPGDEVEMVEEDLADIEEPLLVASAAGTPGETSTSTEEPSGPIQLGSYLGNNDMLLRYDDESNQWLRLPPRSAISPGDRLLALPTFRTHVVLADVNTYLSGGTQLVLLKQEETEFAGEVDLSLSLTYGEVLLNAGLDGSRIGFSAGDQERVFKLGGSASLAVAVKRIFVPGSDNERQFSPVEIVWYLTSGSIDWSGPSGETQVIKGPATWKTVDGNDDLPQAIEELPGWIDREPMTDMQRRAHVELDKELSAGEPVRLRLMELSDQEVKGRRFEVRTLASEASVHIGEFEPFVKSLSDKDQRRAWGSHIDTLRQAIALSPDAAAGVREAFVNLRGEEAGGDLMEMIAGYNQEQIGLTREDREEGAVVKLIRWLENDSLDYRVLAIRNLDEITGVKGTASWKGFRPEGPPRQRKIAIAKIWQSFEADDFLPKP